MIAATGIGTAADEGTMEDAAAEAGEADAGGTTTSGSQNEMSGDASGPAATGGDEAEGNAGTAEADGSGGVVGTSGDEFPGESVGIEESDRRRSRTADATLGLPRQHADRSAGDAAALPGREGRVGSKPSDAQVGWIGKSRAGGLERSSPSNPMSMSMRALPLPPSAARLGIRPDGDAELRKTKGAAAAAA